MLFSILCAILMANPAVGAKLSAPNAPVSLQLLPGSYTTSTNPQLLHNLLTASGASLSPSPGFEIATKGFSPSSLPLDLSLSPGMTVYSGILYSGQATYSGYPETPEVVTNASGPQPSQVSAASFLLADDMYVVMGGSNAGSDRVVVWDSVPDATQLPFSSSSSSTSTFSIFDIVSTTCNPTCSSNGLCSPTTNTCVCAPGFTGSSCEACAPGFFGPQCTQCPSGCAQCDEGIQGTGRCLKTNVTEDPASCGCVNGQCGTGGQCACNAGWKDGAGGKCSVCQDGFYLTSSGDCQVRMEMGRVKGQLGRWRIITRENVMLAAPRAPLALARRIFASLAAAVNSRPMAHVSPLVLPTPSLRLDHQTALPVTPIARRVQAQGSTSARLVPPADLYFKAGDVCRRASQCLSCTDGEVLRQGKCVQSNGGCETLKGLGICLSDLVVAPTNSSTGGNTTEPTIPGLSDPTKIKVENKLEWWQILLMVLGCLFLVLLVIIVWRRHARKKRAERTRVWATERGVLGGKGGSWWRRVFARKQRGAYGVRSEKEERLPRYRDDVVSEHPDPTVDGLIDAYADERSSWEYGSRRSSLRSRSLFSEITGERRKAPEPRVPVREHSISVKSLRTTKSAATRSTASKKSISERN
ncbi:hypothetical protein NP233_g12421 [Leucocoprinus birnbaumii]|uniref:EGF-like domain-containing protein n=1 Tax=Leucocoprinus birnbaumii TaxID=56174 RepID=A0AAD5VK73_9AGAR|nr:hypothetical protein NP233_g12421 [Leucocoprinus birnbaumii]